MNLVGIELLRFPHSYGTVASLLFAWGSEVGILSANHRRRIETAEIHFPRSVARAKLRGRNSKNYYRLIILQMSFRLQKQMIGIGCMN
jgi:hypothetical protein